ncbi:MAG: DNA polymerase III subunit beta [Desulfobacteraceae bacterium]|nr:MAG: DNA polymerase III subunit beta [Desulfobacteraceae bacterium]
MEETMEVSVRKEEMLKAMGRVQGIIEKKSNMPILSTVLLNASEGIVNVSATDLELGFQQKFPAKVIEEGSITLPGRKFFEILKETRKEEINLKENPNRRVIISDGVARFELGFLSPDDFPQLVELTELNEVAVKGQLLSEMISKIIYAVTTEEAGFKLSGVFLHTSVEAQSGRPILTMVATDGHRLSLVESLFSNADELGIADGIMVPKKGMVELGKLAAEAEVIKLGIQKKLFQAKTDGANLVIRLLDSRFPDYKGVMPKSEDITKIEVKRSSLLEAMKRMVILCDDRYRAVRITLEKDIMEVFSTNPDLGEAQENMKVIYGGEKLEVGFNPRYFIEALQPLVSETVVLGFVDSTKPCIITGEADNGFTGLIMPMRL